MQAINPSIPVFLIMKFLISSLLLVLSVLSASTKCPNGQVYYKKQCLTCDKKSGPVCSKEGIKYKSTCSLTLNGDTISLDFALIKGECKVICPTDGFAVCATGSNGEGIYFRNFCLLLEAGYTEISSDYYADPGSNSCNPI